MSWIANSSLPTVVVLVSNVRNCGCNPKKVLARHDSHTAFELIGDLMDLGSIAVTTRDPAIQQSVVPWVPQRRTGYL